MKHILFAAITALMLVSCAKEQACEQNNVGSLNIYNDSGWVLNYEFAGQSGSIPPHSNKAITVFAGTYTLNAVAQTTPQMVFSQSYIITECLTLPVHIQ